MLLTRRIAALAVAAFISGGNVGLCAGWEATAEARMACCAEGGSCPMHQPAGQDSGSSRVVSQAEADSCCAASESDDSTPSASNFVPTVSLAAVASPVLLVVLPTRASFDFWRAPTPRPGSQVPKHLLLSVFLI